MSIDFKKFENLSFEKFKQLATDESLSCYEKIGFPDSYRKGYEENIFTDVRTKLKNLGLTNKIVLDIGPGCSDLPRMLINWCRDQQHSLILIDSQEVLSLLPNESFMTKIPARYPEECLPFIEQFAGQVDVILTYSVFHYIFSEGNVFSFIDNSLKLLREQGEMLIGDIPNVSKRKRFFSSTTGIKYHQEFMKTADTPKVTFNTLEQGEIDDAISLAVVARCRSFGFDAYLMPQSTDLPMANRREDVLIRRP
ncbi:MAG: SAM-dependent methyltransferase [Thiotrichaceae bacterium IS1]|nr:MAG: SAM-dependent methyltransferase [Thiotrichaceae bacterium IS1]